MYKANSDFRATAHMEGAILEIKTYCQDYSCMKTELTDQRPSHELNAIQSQKISSLHVLALNSLHQF